MIGYRNDSLYKQLIAFGKNLLDLLYYENVKADGPYFIDIETKSMSELLIVDEEIMQSGRISTGYGGRTLNNIHRDHGTWHVLSLYNPKYNKYLKIYVQGFQTIRGK